MGGEEESSAALVVLADEKAPLSSQTSFDPSVQQRWSELETIHLIAAYQEKWYLLKRGQLKARHWEEVANNVFLRGGGSEPSKSSVQCRHKVEKLRKKYREEKQLEEQRGPPGSSSWPYFEHMDAMEHGRPINKVIPSAPFASASAAGNGHTTRNTRFRFRWQQERSDRDYEPPTSLNNDTHDSSPPPITPRMRGSVRVKGGPIRHAEHVRVESPRVTLRPKLRKNYSMDEGQDDKPAIPDMSSSDVFSKRMKTELASVVRSLGEGFLRIEQMKLEMQRDNERLRAEVELKRMGMLLDSQKQIAEMFTKALTGKKGVKKRQLQEL